MRNHSRLAGALLQKLDRDTQKCAYKCCFAVINDKPVSCVSVCGCVCKYVVVCCWIDPSFCHCQSQHGHLSLGS